MDLAIAVLVFACFTLRVLTLPRDAIGYLNLWSTVGLPRSYLIPADCCAGAVAINMQLEQIIRTCMSLSCIFIGLRIFEIFRIYRNAGVLSIILTKMLSSDVVQFSALLLVIFFAFGLAFQVTSR